MAGDGAPPLRRAANGEERPEPAKIQTQSLPAPLFSSNTEPPLTAGRSRTAHCSNTHTAPNELPPSLPSGGYKQLGRCWSLPRHVTCSPRSEPIAGHAGRNPPMGVTPPAVRGDGREGFVSGVGGGVRPCALQSYTVESSAHTAGHLIASLGQLSVSFPGSILKHNYREQWQFSVPPVSYLLGNKLHGT